MYKVLSRILHDKKEFLPGDYINPEADCFSDEQIKALNETNSITVVSDKEIESESAAEKITGLLEELKAKQAQVEELQNAFTLAREHAKKCEEEISKLDKELEMFREHCALDIHSGKIRLLDDKDSIIVKPAGKPGESKGKK